MKNKYSFIICTLLAFIFSCNLFAGDGSESSPFTIAEAIKIKDKSKNYWIKGYIIGEIEDYSNNKYFWSYKPPFVGRCNWLLADSKEEKELTKCMPIQLKNGDICDTLNLDWNPQFWRKEIMAYGKFDNYYATWGLKSIEEIRVLSPYPLEDETEGYVDPEDPEDPDNPNPPISNLPQYIYEDFNRIEKEQPNFDIGKEMDRFTQQEGWYGQYVTTAKGKIRLGFESSKGWIQTPAANLSGNGGNYIASFDAWDFGNDKEHKRINVYVHKGKEHIQTQEVLITSEQKNYTFKGKYGGDDVVFTFSAQQGSKNRFYLDNVDIMVDQSAVIDPKASYFEDFEDGIKELDVDFLTTYEEGLYVGANGKWNLVGAKLDEDASARKNRRKSVVIRLTENQEGDTGYIEMMQDKPNGADEISFYAANYGSEKGAKLFVAYSKDKGKTWVNIAENVSITSDLIQYKYSIKQEGNIRVKIGKTDKTPMRACVDDINITSYESSSSIEKETNASIKLKKENGDYYLYTPESVLISAYNITGNIIAKYFSSTGWEKVNLSGNGIFIIKVDNRSFKLIK